MWPAYWARSASRTANRQRFLRAQSVRIFPAQHADRIALLTASLVQPSF